MPYLMGIDVGTSSVKVLIIPIDGTQPAIVAENYDVILPQTAYVEQNMETLWNSTAETIRSAILKAGIRPDEIKGIGLSGQMHGLVLLDKNLKLIRNAIIWEDQRSKNQVENLSRKISIEKYRAVTFNTLSTGFYLSSLLWVMENEPGNYEKIFKAVLPKDYIRFRLCGAIGTDVSDASGTLVFDIKNKQWAREISDQLGIDNSIFPDCHRSFEIAGTVSPSSSAETGLAVGTPIIFGGGDQPMQMLGSGIINPGVVSVNIGTGSQVACMFSKPLHDQYFRSNTFCSVQDDMWILMGASLNGGVTLKWLRENLFPDLSYRDFDRCAESIVPGSKELLFLPYISGERCPYMDPNAKGVLFGVTLKSNRNQFIRAVMEGVVYSLKDCMQIFYDLGVPVDKVIASGGGSRSEVWLQMQADILQKEIYTTQCREEASLGAAIAAGTGAGIFSSLQEACDTLVKIDERVTSPNAAMQDVYNEKFQQFKELYKVSKKLF